MKKENVYKTLIGLLLVVNALQLGGHFLPSKSPQQTAAPTMPAQKETIATNSRAFRDEAIHLLQLNDAQKSSFMHIAQAHKARIADLQQQQNQLTQRYFQQPSQVTLDEIADLDKQKIQATAQHFDEVYHLLNHEQQAHFETFKHAALNVIIP